MPMGLKAMSVTMLPASAAAAEASAQTCLHQSFSDETEFSIYSNDRPAPTELLYRDVGGSYVRTLGRAEQKQILRRFNQISRMLVQ